MKENRCDESTCQESQSVRGGWAVGFDVVVVTKMTSKTSGENTARCFVSGQTGKQKTPGGHRRRHREKRRPPYRAR